MLLTSKSKFLSNYIVLYFMLSSQEGDLSFSQSTSLNVKLFLLFFLLLKTLLKIIEFEVA